MPIFDFQCQDCQATFDDLVRSAESVKDVRCARCGSARVERLLSVFAAGGSRAGSSPRPSAGERPSGGGCGSGCGCHA